jgi:hypothetical protein
MDITRLFPIIKIKKKMDKGPDTFPDQLLPTLDQNKCGLDGAIITSIQEIESANTSLSNDHEALSDAESKKLFDELCGKKNAAIIESYITQKREDGSWSDSDKKTIEIKYIRFDYCCFSSF